MVGAGLVGGMVATLLRTFPLDRLQLVDLDRGREHLADTLGVDFAHPDLKANVWVNPGEVAGEVVASPVIVLVMRTSHATTPPPPLPVYLSSVQSSRELSDAQLRKLLAVAMRQKLGHCAGVLSVVEHHEPTVSLGEGTQRPGIGPVDVQVQPVGAGGGGLLEPERRAAPVRVHQVIRASAAVAEGHPPDLRDGGRVLGVGCG